MFFTAVASRDLTMSADVPMLRVCVGLSMAAVIFRLSSVLKEQLPASVSTLHCEQFLIVWILISARYRQANRSSYWNFVSSDPMASTYSEMPAFWGQLYVTLWLCVTSTHSLSLIPDCYSGQFQLIHVFSPESALSLPSRSVFCSRRGIPLYAHCHIWHFRLREETVSSFKKLSIRSFLLHCWKK